MPAIEKFGFLKFVITADWNPVDERFGGLFAIYGTLLTSFVAILLAVPLSIGVAIFITELAPPQIRGLLASLVDLLAAIPSIIYGMWGLFVLAPILKEHVEPMLARYLSFIPLFSGIPHGIDVLNASVVLTLMIVPYITSITREVFSMVPSILKESAYALGSTRWEVIRYVVIPYTRSGILAGVVLGLGRALGETMAVTFVIGNAHAIPKSLFEPGITIASAIANEFTEAVGEIYYSSLFLLAFILFIITFIVMSLGRLVILRLESRFRT